MIKESGKVTKIKLSGCKNSMPVLIFNIIMIKVSKSKKNCDKILLSEQDGKNEQGEFFFKFFLRAG